MIYIFILHWNIVTENKLLRVLRPRVLCARWTKKLIDMDHYLVSTSYLGSEEKPNGKGVGVVLS